MEARWELVHGPAEAGAESAPDREALTNATLAVLTAGREETRDTDRTAAHPTGPNAA
jgi:hypothetical protein